MAGPLCGDRTSRSIRGCSPAPAWPQRETKPRHHQVDQPGRRATPTQDESDGAETTFRWDVLVFGRGEVRKARQKRKRECRYRHSLFTWGNRFRENYSRRWNLISFSWPIDDARL